MSADRPGLYEDREDGLIDNDAWLGGYGAFEAGEPVPWGDHSARAGWLAAKAEA